MKRLTLFAHYDGGGEVKRYVLFHLSALRAVSSELWFISSATLSDDELGKARKVCERAWTRENVGYDFGMWKEALARIDVTEWDEVVLTNSSVFGPLSPLDEVFARAPARADFWGMTENPEVTSHLQSYFLVFRARLLRSPEFANFWNDVAPLRDKRRIIESYEVGLTRTFSEAGFRGEPLVSMAGLPKRSMLVRFRRPHLENPTIVQPVALLERGMPYVKVELLRDNPGKVRLGPVRQAMLRAGYDPSLVEIGGARTRKLELGRES